MDKNRSKTPEMPDPNKAKKQPEKGLPTGPQEEVKRDWSREPGGEDILRQQHHKPHQHPGLENPIMPDPERSL